MTEIPMETKPFNGERQRLSNVLNLPAPLVAAIARDEYDNGGADISITTLLKPPRMVELERRHWHEIVEDANERIWSLIGRIGHAILAAGAQTNLVEYRLFMNCLGWKVSGQVDILNEHTISDYKFVSVWSIKDGPKIEWIQQLNLYRLLAEKLEIQPLGIQTLEVCAVLRDWSKLEAKRSSEYPQSGVQMFQLPIWTLENAQAFLEHRVRLHQEAREILPECSSEETWERPDKWAVMKQGRKSALRVLESEEEALAWAIDNDWARHDDEGVYKWKEYIIAFHPGISIVKRPGERVRCASYCAVADFCEQWKQYNVV